MKRIIFTITFCLILLAVNVYGQNNKSQHESMASDTLVINDAGLFYKADFSIHGIAFDNQGLMYVGGGKEIYTITPNKEVKHFIALNDTTENTIIWSLRFGPDRALYVAAKDRLVKISPKGEQTVIFKETFPGPCGVTDLRFDNKGDLFIVYHNVVAKCDSNYQRQIIIDGSQFVPPMVWLVGIEFSSDFKTLYLGDCRGKHAYVTSYLSKDFIDKTKSFPTDWGQYFTQDKLGNVYLTSVSQDQKSPDFVMFTPDNKRLDLCSKNRVPQYRGNHKKAMAWGQKGFNENAIYCIIGSHIYEYDLKEIASRNKSLNQN